MGPERPRRAESPPEGAAVFENSTACAPAIDSIAVCVQVRPATRRDSFARGRAKSQVGNTRHGLRPRCIGRRGFRLPALPAGVTHDSFS